jgi:serine/threonine protein kinase
MLQIAPDTLLQQRYRILSSLGAGGFGRTYLATDRSRFDEYCAIKELTPSTQSAAVVAKAKEFFQQEANLLYQLQHPQIPRFWATFEEEERLFLVQDYIAGKTYAHLLDDRREVGENFTETEIWRFLLQVLPVLGYIHSKGVIHRDVSPENIILRDSDRLPVLIDFGIVKEFADRLQAHPVSRSNLSVGKAGYAPIEQLKRGEAYPNSDLYALAVTAIVLLTGKEATALFVNGSMNWDWRNWTYISDGLANVLYRMLSVNPSDRYQSGVDVFQALQSLSISNSSPTISGDGHSNATDRQPVDAPRVATPSKKPSVGNRVHTALSNLQLPSIWEKPQVFIPLAMLIAVLAGFGSWFVVGQLLHSRSLDGTPSKQVDFNNPTIATDPNPIVPGGIETIEAMLGKIVTKEGLVTAANPVKYRIVAVAGQNLDIQLVTMSGSVPTVKKTGSAPTSATSAQSSNQVLMTILSPTGVPIDAKADRVVSWRGQIVIPGDYTIELRPIVGLGSSSFPYKLTVTQLTSIPTPLPPGFENTPLAPTLPGADGMMPFPPGELPENPQTIISPTFDPVPIPMDGIPTYPPIPIVPEPSKTKKKSPVIEKPPTQPKDRKNTPKPADKKPPASPTIDPADNNPPEEDDGTEKPIPNSLIDRN